MITRFFNALGAPLLAFWQYLGEVVLLAADTVMSIFTHKLRWKLFLNQIVEIGLLSQLVVVITGAFTGAVFAAQTFFQFNKIGMGSATGAVVSVAICRELGPVLTALMVAGRVGAAMAAEIGTMKGTEQIDALTSLSTDPLRYLVLPRLIAGLVTMPVLVLVADIVGVFGGFLLGTYKLEFNPGTYLSQTEQYLQTMDVVSGLIKAAVFGFIIALMGCYHGYHSRGGAEGVGQATTHAVVSSSILILIFNYALTQAFFS